MLMFQLQMEVKILVVAGQCDESWFSLMLEVTKYTNLLVGFQNAIAQKQINYTYWREQACAHRPWKFISVYRLFT